ncbi:MAG: TonB-dependent receptor [Prevotella sp.]|nr:TonB-dependent receptor [Prevotella sp.]
MCIASAAAPSAVKTALRGRITDAATGEPVVGASVYFPQLKQGTVSDPDGRYEITGLPALRTTVQVSYVGHQTIIETVDLRRVTKLDFKLQENNAMLSEVVVQGLTGSSLAARSPSPVSVVTPQELMLTASTNIIDAVARQPGVDQLTTGTGISKPVIRGLGYNRIVVVNDGLRQEGQQWGDEHGIEVDAQSVHSVEILKGPASLMYGSDALAGVLVMHEEPVMPQGTMAATVGGEYQSVQHLYDYTADFAGNRGGVVWNWRWSEKDAGEYRNRRDGRVPGSQFHEQALTGMLGLNRAWGYSHLKLSAYHLKPGLVEGERDAVTGRLEPSDAYQQIYHYKALLDNSFLLGNGTLKALVGYQQNRRKEFESPEGEESASPSERSTFNDHAPQALTVHTPEASLDFRLHTVNYDVHYLYQAPEHWSVAAGVQGMWQRSENLGDEYLIPAYRLFDAGVFASANYEHDRLTLSGGLRYDHRRLHSYALEDDGEPRFSDFRRNFSGLTGSLGAIYNLSRQANLRLNVSRGFRAPNMSELGSNGEHEGTFRYELGNSRLASEKSWQADLGVDYSTAVVSTQLSVFVSDISDFVYLRRLSPLSDRYEYQSGHARLWGGEAVVDVHPVEPLHFENSFSLVNARQLHQPEDARWLPFTPAPRWTSTLRYDIVRDGRRLLNNAFAAATMTCHLRQSHAHTANETETATPSYTLVDLSAGTDLQRRGHRLCTLLLTVQNLFDRVYTPHLSRLKYAEDGPIAAPGRNVIVKIHVPIKLHP